MAADMFLMLDKIKGESVDDGHKDEIDILSWSWGASQSGTTHTSKGGGSGKVNVQDITIVKGVDKSTPVILKHCATGIHIPKAVLTVRKAGGSKPLEYYKLTMEDVLVSSISSGGSGGADRLTETITLNFGRYVLEYTPQKEDGSGDAAVKSGYNIAENKEI